MAWQRIHRPRKVSQLHLTEVREALQQMMAQGSFPQVLLFAGPKGTGKTSASRIIGNLLNDPQNAVTVDAVFFGKKAPKNKQFKEPDTDSEFAERIYAGNSYVVQEMDAASYRGIDDVRALKERVMMPPQEGKVAVYILDEAHMFTTEAFNALLKLLEEPPAHAMFILATTELHKVPETIISRSTKLDFRKATEVELLDSLKFVAEAEKVKYDEAALLQLAQRADGSFRDAVKLLELVAQSGEVSLKSTEAALGQSAEELIKELVEAVLAKNARQVSQSVAELREKNIQESYFYKSLFSTLHQSLMQDLGAESGEPLVPAKVARFLLQELLKGDLQQYSPVPFLPLELKLLEVVERAQQQNGAAPAKKKIVKTAETVVQPTKVIAEKIETPLVENSPSGSDFPKDEQLQQMAQSLVEQWEQFLQVVHERNATLAALLRSAKPALGEDGITEVGVFYKFHQEQLQQQKYMALIQDCAKDVVGASLPFQISLQSAPREATLLEVEETAEDLARLAEDALM